MFSLKAFKNILKERTDELIDHFKTEGNDLNVDIIISDMSYYYGKKIEPCILAYLKDELRDLNVSLHEVGDFNEKVFGLNKGYVYYHIKLNFLTISKKKNLEENYEYIGKL